MRTRRKYSAEAERLRHFIYSKFLTVEEFAHAAGLSAESIRSGYLSGRSLLGGNTIRQLIKTVGFDPVYYLIGDTTAQTARTVTGSASVHPFSSRLLRFIEHRYHTKVAFAEAVHITRQALNQSYFGPEPFPGSSFFANLTESGCDLNWLLTGRGCPPEPATREEAEWWIAYCENQAAMWRARLELEKLTADRPETDAVQG